MTLVLALEVGEQGTDQPRRKQATPWSWAPASPYRCPRCASIHLTRDLAARCPACGFIEGM